MEERESASAHLHPDVGLFFFKLYPTPTTGTPALQSSANSLAQSALISQLMLAPISVQAWTDPEVRLAKQTGVGEGLLSVNCWSSSGSSTCKTRLSAGESDVMVGLTTLKFHVKMCESTKSTSCNFC